MKSLYEEALSKKTKAAAKTVCDGASLAFVEVTLLSNSLSRSGFWTQSPEPFLSLV